MEAQVVAGSASALPVSLNGGYDEVMPDVNERAEANAVRHREFRKFVRVSGEANLFRAFILWQKQLDPDRSQRWWARRWGVDPSNVFLWCQPFDGQFRRVPPDAPKVWGDLRRLAGFDMDEYYSLTPPSNQGAARATRSARATKKIR